MGTRKIKDAKDLETGEKIYLKGHAKATYLSDGNSVEDAIIELRKGSGGGGGAISVKMDVDMDESTGEFFASESRAAAYTSILECLMAGTACNVILCGAGLSATSVFTSADESEDGKPVISMAVIMGLIDNAPMTLSVSLKSDGLIVMG